MPAVSVIMPGYNVEPYIGVAIESVLAQTFTDWELIVIDDGSTDRTSAIAEAFTREDPRLRLVRQENRGISAARNHGLRVSTAPFIAILDSDDLWAPTFLATQMAVFDANPDVDVVTGNAWFLGGKFDGHPARPTPDTRPNPDLLTILSDEMSMFIMSVFRRRVYDTIGGFDETMRCNEDYDFWLRAATAGFRFVRNDQPLGHYRRRDDSLSADELRMLRGILRVFYKLRPSIASLPGATAILDAQIDRFETERLAAEVRAAIEARDFREIEDFLAALHARRGGALLGIARLLARWSPGLLSRAYELRRARQPVQ